MKTNNPIFSVVIAVYNCEPFLRETLDSIVNQDLSGLTFYSHEEKCFTENAISFEELLEVIMVDDGSKDSSGAICDEYAEKYPNFKVIHKENGGVASARNEGMKHVRGRYMNFLDSDDTFSQRVFYEMYRFFEEHYDETDVITMPIRFFDATTGGHWQNYKFKKHSRIANLYNEYDCPLMFVNASFFKSEFKDKISFDPALVCGEDIKFITEILSDKMTLGLVPHCHYGYRRRSSGEESLVQSAKKKVGWYFDYLDHLTAWAIDFSRKKWGFIPRYVQNIILCDLQWRFFNDYEPTAIKVLGDDGYESYKQKLYSLLGAFDDDIILGQRIIFNEHKCMILSKKYGSLPEKCVYSDDIRLRFNNTCFSWLSGCYTKYDFIRIENGRISIEGFTTAIGYPDDADYRVVYEATSLINGSRREIECEIIPERDVNRYRLDEIMMRGIAFKLDVPACTLADSEIMLVLYANGNRIVKKDVRFGKYCTIGKEFKNAYYLKESFVITVRNNAFVIRPCGRRGALKHEQAFRKELRKSTRLGAKKAAFARFLNSVLLKFKRKPIFLISDRINKASDNGEALFRYLTDTRYRKAKFYYAIRSDCPDYERLSSMKGVINRDSRKYKRIHLAADVIISSHADNNVVDPFIGYSAPYRDILNEKKFVFLQHGVTKDDISAWLNRYNKNLSGFVCSAEREAKSVVEGTYFYDPEAVWLTGMPRFDRLYENGKRLITIMPTWRMYLSVSNNGADSTWKTSPAFLKSEYFNFYNSLINNEKLITACKNHGYTLAFMPHPNLISNIDLFTKNDEVIFFGIDKEYRDIYAESSLVLTDYSSAVFDFAYMRKPVVYAHFDKEEFFAGEHVYTPGYFDYERDGFGEVTYDLDSTVDTLISYIESDCKLKEEYSERIENFFAFSDKDNSKRVIEKTEELVNIK